MSPCRGWMRAEFAVLLALWVLAVVSAVVG